MRQALAHAAQADHGQHGLGTVIGFGQVQRFVRRKGFAHLGMNRPARIDHGGGVLEHDLHMAALAAPLRRADPGIMLAPEGDRAAGGRFDARNHAAERGFAAAAFPHDA